VYKIGYKNYDKLGALHGCNIDLSCKVRNMVSEHV